MLIRLVLAQAVQIAAPMERIAAKTPDNSSVPASRGQKPNQAEQRKAKSKGRLGSFCALSSTLAFSGCVAEGVGPGLREPEGEFPAVGPPR